MQIKSSHNTTHTGQDSSVLYCTSSAVNDSDSVFAFSDSDVIDQVVCLFREWSVHGDEVALGPDVLKVSSLDTHLKWWREGDGRVGERLGTIERG